MGHYPGAVQVSRTSKLQGIRELKNLECSINFDARGVGSSQVKGKRALVVL
jgi:hypothetical protein